MHRAVFLLVGLWFCFTMTFARAEDEPRMTAPWPPLANVDPMVQNGLGVSPYARYELRGYKTDSSMNDATFAFRSAFAITYMQVFVRVDFYRGYGTTGDGNCEDITHIIVRHAICEHGTYDVLVGMGNDEEYPCFDRSPSALVYRVVPQESTTLVHDRLTVSCGTTYAFTGKFYTEHSAFEEKMFSNVTDKYLLAYRAEDVLVRVTNLLRKPAEAK